MRSLDMVPIPNENVVGRMVDGEAVLVLPEKGKVKVLNEVGASIWSLVDGRRSAREIAAALCDEYQVEPQEAEVDTLAFLDELEKKGVLRLPD